MQEVELKRETESVLDPGFRLAKMSSTKGSTWLPGRTSPMEGMATDEMECVHVAFRL